MIARKAHGRAKYTKTDDFKIRPIDVKSVVSLLVLQGMGRWIVRRIVVKAAILPDPFIGRIEREPCAIEIILIRHHGLRARFRPRRCRVQSDGMCGCVVSFDRA